MTTTLVETAPPAVADRQPGWAWLRGELALTPARSSRIVRMTVLVMLIVLVSMTLRVPEAAISAYMVFFVLHDDAKTTVKAGIGVIVLVTLLVPLALAVLSLTLGEPALRLVAIVGLVFVAMYAQRISPTVGLLGYAAGFLLVVILTYVDQVPSPEGLTRAVWWLWVILAYPSLLIVLSEAAFGAKPEALYRDGLADRLLAASASLAASPEAERRERRHLDVLLGAGTRGFATYAALPPAAAAPLRTALLAEVERLLLAVRHLPSLPLESPLRGSLRRGSELCLLLRSALLGESAPLSHPPDPRPTSAEAALADPRVLGSIHSIASCLEVLVLGVEQLQAVLRSPPAGPAPVSPFAAEDAPRRRTDAVHFAVKVTLAATTAYVVYTALAWPGIHTALITCFFVAQESLGATIHKLSLRIVGALAGGTLGICALIFVLPHLDSGGGLALVVGAVVLVAAWIATGSQLSSYAGWQLAFAFFLTVLQGFSRSSNMVVARDRVLGILLGNVLMTLIFANIWPVRVGPRIREGVMRALDALAAMLATGPAAPGAIGQMRTQEQVFVESFSAARQDALFRPLEPGGYDVAWMLPVLGSLLAPVRALSLGSAASALQPEDDTLARIRSEMSQWLTRLARAVQDEQPPPPAYGGDPLPLPGGRPDGAGELPPPAEAELLQLIREQLDQLAQRRADLAAPGGTP